MSNPVEFSPEWFDESSRAWMANKKRRGAMYVYVCEHVKADGGVCQRPVYRDKPYCWHHRNSSQTKMNTALEADQK